MAHISYPFKKTNKSVYKKPASVLTEDNLYWKKLGVSLFSSVANYSHVTNLKKVITGLNANCKNLLLMFISAPCVSERIWSNRLP